MGLIKEPRHSENAFLWPETLNLLATIAPPVSSRSALRYRGFKARLARLHSDRWDSLDGEEMLPVVAFYLNHPPFQCLGNEISLCLPPC